MSLHNSPSQGLFPAEFLVITGGGGGGSPLDLFHIWQQGQGCLSKLHLLKFKASIRTSLNGGRKADHFFFSWFESIIKVFKSKYSFYWSLFLKVRTLNKGIPDVSSSMACPPRLVFSWVVTRYMLVLEDKLNLSVFYLENLNSGFQRGKGLWPQGTTVFPKNKILLIKRSDL